MTSKEDEGARKVTLFGSLRGACLVLSRAFHGCGLPRLQGRRAAVIPTGAATSTIPGRDVVGTLSWRAELVLRLGSLESGLESVERIRHLLADMKETNAVYRVIRSGSAADAKP